MPQSCNLCGGADFELIAEQDRRGEPLATVLCTTCGLISHETVPTPSELRAFYRDQYRRSYKGVHTPPPHRVLRAWNLGGGLLRQLRPFLNDDDRVLEIGAGMGATVKQFALAGFEAAGIEPDRGIREFGRNQLRSDLEDGELADLPQTPHYDLILLHHVLEHLPAPRQALEHIRRLLHAGGRAYIEVPNAAAPHAAPGKMFHAAHIYNFTPRTLTALANAAGLAVKHVFTQPTQEIIGVLLTPSLRAAANVDFAGGGEETRSLLHRYNTLTYHLRPRYLAERVVRGVALSSDHIAARSRMQSILKQCAATANSVRIAVRAAA